MNLDPFTQRLLEISDEKSDFVRARHEWSLRLLIQHEAHECLCGRIAREEICLIEHHRTRKHIRIGSCCAEKYMEIQAKKIFSAWARVSNDPSKAFNEAFVEFAFGTGVLTLWERDFYRDTWRRRALSLDQERKRRQINFKAIREVRARRVGYSGRADQIGH
jgi:hypothetical protein